MALINSDTFINTGLLGETRKKIVETPPVREGFEHYEEVFYSTISGNVRYGKWLDLIYSSRFVELAVESKEKVLMWLQDHLFLTRENVIELFQIESQRRLEMYYVHLVLNEIARGNRDLRNIVQPDILNGLMGKYPMLKEEIMHPTPTTRPYTKRVKIEVPAYDHDAMFREKSNKSPASKLVPKPIQKPVKERLGTPGRKPGQGNFDNVELLRRALIHCEPIPKISKTLKYSQETLYNVMEKNSFTQPTSYRKEEDTYLESVKGSIARHGGTWGDFIEKHVICERALYKKLVTTDPDFVKKYNVIPTPHSIMFELDTNVRNKAKVAELFGVTTEDVTNWIKVYNLFKPIKMVKKTERAGGLITEDQEVILRGLKDQWKKDMVSQRKE